MAAIIMLGRRLSTRFRRRLDVLSDDDDTKRGQKYEPIMYTRFISIDELLKYSRFTRSELKFLYKGFKEKCPSGLLTESRLNEIYADIFTTGDCKLFSKHLFAALVQNSRHLRDENSPANDDQIYFQHFIANLSVLVRGNLEERVKWLFSFYDLNKNGQINLSEITSMVNCMYNLMGPNVNPIVDENSVNNHVDFILRELGLEPNGHLTYDDFLRLFLKQTELIENMLKIF